MVNTFMELSDKQIKIRLCDQYLQIVAKSMSPNISLEELCRDSKISYDRAKKIVPQNFIETFFFLKIYISKVDKKVLNDLKIELMDDDVSTVYDKILEGITIRFEAFLKHKRALKILSQGFGQKIEIFFKLLKENVHFMSNLLAIVENESENFLLNKIKSVALNFVFVKSLEKFLKDESSEIDSTIRLVDKYLTEIEDLGFMLGIIKKQS